MKRRHEGLRSIVIGIGTVFRECIIAFDGRFQDLGREVDQGRELPDGVRTFDPAFVDLAKIVGAPIVTVPVGYVPTRERLTNRSGLAERLVEDHVHRHRRELLHPHAVNLGLTVAMAPMHGVPSAVKRLPSLPTNR